VRHGESISAAEVKKIIMADRDILPVTAVEVPRINLALYDGLLSQEVRV